MTKEGCRCCSHFERSGYDPVNPLIKDPVEFAEYVRKMADLAVDILDTIDNKL
ncbi:hypothetical protein N5V81_22225 [Escherichia coli]|nr:hypothetical protein [Escherichia coli]